MDHIIFKGLMNKEDFFGFICNLLEFIEEDSSPSTRFVFLMDNSSTYKAKDFMQKYVLPHYAL